MVSISHSKRSFDLLATELVELILTHLDGASIVRASAVCQRFHHLITSSARLQYQIELCIEGLSEDALYPALPLSARIAALARYKKCWNELKLPKEPYHIICPGSPEEYTCFPAGGWLVDHSVEDSAIRIAKLPAAEDSKAQGDVKLDWKEMSLASDGDGDDGSAARHYSTIALQGLNMLIVLGVKERLPDGTTIPKVSLLDADTFGPHPLAAHAELPWPASAGPVTGVNWESMGLCGRSLAITLQQGRICVVFDWLRGTPLLVCPLAAPPSAHNWLLLTERAFCWTVHADRQVVLHVRRFDDAGRVWNLGRYAFPRLAKEPFIAEVSLTTDDADELAPAHRLDARYPFLTGADGAESALALTLVVLTHHAEGVRDSAWTFYALRSTLLQQQPDDEIVPWERWGPQGARCVPGEAQAIRGCRAVHASDEDETLCDTSLLTFLPAACRAAASSTPRRSVLFPDGAKSRQRLVDTPSVVDEPTIFDCKVETTLPYLVAESRLEEGVGLPRGALSWWEDGRVVWTTLRDPRVCRVVQL